MSKFTDWIASIRTPSTRDTYREHLLRLFSLASIEPDRALEVMLDEPKFGTYIRLVNIAKAQKASVERLMTFALRRYLFDNGCLMLPRSRIQSRPATIVQASITWDQALSICSAASRPYGSIFRLMLHCGFGAGEFLKFNTAENWLQIKKFLEDKGGLPYYRYDFAGRKSNRKDWYALVPRFVLEEFVKAVPDLPVKARSQDREVGIVLGLDRYRWARTYLESAWRTAVRRSTVTLPSGNGRPVRLSVHELRDCFLTRAQKVDCDLNAANFVMGHVIDPYGYNKIYTDLPWMWGELSKIYTVNVVSKQEYEAQEDKIKMLEAKLLDDGRGLVAISNKIEELDRVTEKAEEYSKKLEEDLKRLISEIQRLRGQQTPSVATPAESPPPSPARVRRRKRVKR